MRAAVRAGSAGRRVGRRAEQGSSAVRGARFTLEPSCKPTGLDSLSWLGKVKCLCKMLFIFHVFYTDEVK